MLCRSSLRCAFSRTCPLSTSFPRIVLRPELHITIPGLHCASLCFHSCSVNRKFDGGGSDLATASSTHETAKLVADTSTRRRKKERKFSPEQMLLVKLDQCAKCGDLHQALCLYDEARSTGVKLNHHHYNRVLYVCSLTAASSKSDADAVNENSSDFGWRRGLEIYLQMLSDEVVPDEATFTSAARLAVAADEPDLAFNLVKHMITHNIPPRLRSYGPALYGFCKKGLVERAYQVDCHMVESGVIAEEPELSALLKLSVDNNKAEKVYELLHRLRATVRQVTDPTAKIIADWFNSENASKIGKEDWDEAKIREGAISGGGGWHGQGWLGSGKWKVVSTGMDDAGICHSCGEKLVCIDIDPRETEDFASTLSNLACQKEKTENFIEFKEWLQSHGPFDAVVDAANIGLFDGKSFEFDRLDDIVNHLRDLSLSKRLPLIVLHVARVTGGPAKKPDNKRLLEYWRKSGALYPTPVGSNDDWYWLYAAVSNKCLLVTNDEMRDHLFQLLGTSFFPRWKEKHQVRFSHSLQGPLNLHMPPSYSIVIQESESGHWHVPTDNGDDFESPRQWLCCTRSKNSIGTQERVPRQRKTSRKSQIGMKQQCCYWHGCRVL